MIRTRVRLPKASSVSNKHLRRTVRSTAFLCQTPPTVAAFASSYSSRISRPPYVVPSHPYSSTRWHPYHSWGLCQARLSAATDRACLVQSRSCAYPLHNRRRTVLPVISKDEHGRQRLKKFADVLPFNLLAEHVSIFRCTYPLDVRFYAFLPTYLSHSHRLYNRSSLVPACVSKPAPSTPPLFSDP
ncbi:unnamed protein product [Rangifer tarandus platyrhynchus]|uniref:Uncharacterized protein n=1 Tax=Rangifer tarandus platyrhynchus TaxID=3082113 RepID=A0ABN8XL29_RANTA|nr:unnamed protein product [Rangifer tarandus platyrhynchus]